MWTPLAAYGARAFLNGELTRELVARPTEMAEEEVDAQ